APLDFDLTTGVVVSSLSSVAISGADNVADALAPFQDEWQPAMVRTHTGKDLTAIIAWVRGVLGAMDIDLAIEEQFFLLSSISLDLHLKMDFLNPFLVSHLICLDLILLVLLVHNDKWTQVS
nr:hypothetical protein [Tanacetum cinerariifolium]